MLLLLEKNAIAGQYIREQIYTWYNSFIINTLLKMTQRNFTLSVSVIFLIITVLHLSRIIWDWQATLHTWNIPLWFSYVAVVVAGVLSLSGFKLSGKLK